ncbi:hypothetical protein PTKIN_Ptkin04bG0126000 [Pterospermum kingtungense]
MASNSALMLEIGPDGLARKAPIMAYTEKIIEEERLQLRKYIEENYSKIRDVERELANLTTEMKLTAGPKKAAFEYMSKKIERSTERICIAKQKEEQARKVQESSNSQFARLEELKRQLEALNPTRASTLSYQFNKQQNRALPNQGNCGNVPATGGQNQLPSIEEVKEKKKSHFRGRAEGIGALPKGKGSTASGGWTGAGFDVDARN